MSVFNECGLIRIKLITLNDPLRFIPVTLMDGCICSAILRVGPRTFFIIVGMVMHETQTRTTLIGMLFFHNPHIVASHRDLPEPVQL